MRISRAAFVSRRLASGVSRISPLHQCVPRITSSVMRSSSPRCMIVIPPACSIALRHSWLDISGGNAQGGCGVTFLAMILRAALVSATFSARPSSRSPHTQHFPLTSTGRSMTTCRPCTFRGIPACRRHQPHCRAVWQALIDISATVPFSFSHCEARSARTRIRRAHRNGTSSSVIVEDFPRLEVTVMRAPSGSEGREEVWPSNLAPHFMPPESAASGHRAAQRVSIRTGQHRQEVEPSRTRALLMVARSQALVLI